MKLISNYNCRKERGDFLVVFLTLFSRIQNFIFGCSYAIASPLPAQTKPTQNNSNDKTLVFHELIGESHLSMDSFFKTRTLWWLPKKTPRISFELLQSVKRKKALVMLVGGGFICVSISKLKRCKYKLSEGKFCPIYLTESRRFVLIYGNKSRLVLI